MVRLVRSISDAGLPPDHLNVRLVRVIRNFRSAGKRAKY